ncbi:MAG: acyl-CoA dehydrogenase family protein [Myxococcales bacterium]|nr:acyl-CoA dehydrogenase family protein [Myxococcales bacterium]
MDLSLNEDQQSLMTALEGLAARFQTKPIDFRGLALTSDALDRELAAAEFFDVAATPELGPVAAVLAVERLARLPYAAEVGLSMLVRPHLPGGPYPRPLALLEPARPGRFVAGARTLLIADRDRLGLAQPAAGTTEAVDSLFAYPMGRLAGEVQATPLSPGDALIARSWVRVALCAEAAGLMRAGIDSTVEHLTERKQFGKPLGTFQALRHRLSECAVLAGGVRWLALKAASTAEPGDAALAAFHAQQSVAKVVYDLHQMMGAMGMTLEHPLHLWTYRLKALTSELGGHGTQALAVAHHCFA